METRNGIERRQFLRTLAWGGVLFSGVALWTATARAQTSGGEYVTFPNAQIRLMKPSGFTVAPNFDGFAQAASGASVMITRIPSPYSEATRGFVPSEMQKIGIRLLQKQTGNFDGTPGVLLQISQTVGNATYNKWVGVLGDSTYTLLVTATFPANRPDLSAPLREVVVGMRRDKSAGSPPAGAGLPFTITPAPGLKPTPPMGKVLGFTRDGKIPLASPNDPLFIVAPSIGNPNVAASAGANFARARVMQTTQTRDIVVETHLPVMLDQLSGYESVASGRDIKTGVPITIYQTLLYTSDGYILMQGLVGKAQAAQYIPVFRATARSFQHK